MHTFLTRVAPSLTHMCVPTHPSAPYCTLPAIARAHGRIGGSQTHFCCLLERFPLAFVNTATFLLLVLICLISPSAHTSPVGSHTHEQTPDAHQHLSPLLSASSGVAYAAARENRDADGWWWQAGAERERKERKIRMFLKRSLAAGLTG